MKLRDVFLTVMALICLICAIACSALTIQMGSYWAIFWIVASGVDALDFWNCLSMWIKYYKIKHNKAP